LDEALALGLTSRHKVSEAARCDVQRPGSADLRALAAARGPQTLTRSQAEERFLALIRKAELPPPEINARLHGFGGSGAPGRRSGHPHDAALTSSGDLATRTGRR